MAGFARRLAVTGSGTALNCFPRVCARCAPGVRASTIVDRHRSLPDDLGDFVRQLPGTSMLPMIARCAAFSVPVQFNSLAMMVPVELM